MILLVKTDRSVYGSFPIIVIRVCPVSSKKLCNARLRILVMMADDIAQLPLETDVPLIERPLVYDAEQAVDELRHCFIDDKAITDKDLSERLDITRLRAITEPTFGDVE